MELEPETAVAMDILNPSTLSVEDQGQLFDFGKLSQVDYSDHTICMGSWAPEYNVKLLRVCRF